MTTFRAAATAILLAVALVVPQTLAFTAPQNSARSSSSLNVIPPELHDASILESSSQLLSRLTQEMDKDTARGEFYFFFFAGSGAGGIGLAQIPRIYSEAKSVRALAGEGPSEGGEPVNVGLSSVFYPTMYRKDIEKAIAKVPPSAKISAQGTSTSYLASKGYIDQSDFVMSLKQNKCNPLASNALFEALSGGSGSVVSPDVLEENLAKYRSESDPVATFVSDLQSASLTKLGAYGGLAFLLFIVFALIIESGVSAFL
eukprot:CAMPEP_0197716516 /NCGR_PEP_ID=MMETSP1434-20131217/1385_1 /TAXON_ID=265543 /ORGANISM="Minutocellus polymorphus, Strain CCMP3303" /LENGTH=257 /DNA_ID=CAMNT_0043300891 /DNA_START=20 /DNA_END=793 /DNA_ORIENTATION=+